MKILLVEDNAIVSKFLLENLKLCDMHLCQTLGYAKEMLRTGDYVCVILDLNLPDSRGMETFNELHREFPKQKIAVFSGALDSELEQQIAKAGALTINKTSLSTLKAAVAGVIEKAKDQAACISKLNEIVWNLKAVV